MRRPNPHIALLVFITLVWGATFPALKFTTAQLSGVEVSALRFALSALCVLPWALRAGRSTWRDGAVLGTFLLLSYVSQAYGLQFISSNRSAFLTSLNALMVPFFGLVLGRALRLRAVGAAVLACAGIGLMSWEAGAHAWADALTVLGAAAYAVYNMTLSSRAARHPAMALAATQIVWLALGAGVWMLLGAVGTDQLQTLPARTTLPVLLCLVFLGLVATVGTLWLQAIAQRHVSAEKAALIYSLEPVFAALFGWVLLAEGLGLRASVGAALVVGAVVWSEWRSGPAASSPVAPAPPPAPKGAA